MNSVIDQQKAQIQTIDHSCGVEDQGMVRRQTILLVEDEAFVRQVAAEILRGAGYVVLSVRNATEALRVFQQHLETVNLLLTDVVLPGQSGCFIARRMRESNGGLKILFITGYAEQIALRTAGDGEFLAKPFSGTALLERVARLLGQSAINAREENNDVSKRVYDSV